MANRNSSAKATPSATLDKTPAAYHAHTKWLTTGAALDSNAQFADKVMDISRGCRAIGTILCQHLLDLNMMRDNHSIRPLLNENDTEALARLMVVSLQDLHVAAEIQVERLNQVAHEGARA